MDKNTQALSWACLPNGTREYFRERYKTALTAYNSGAEYGFVLTMLEKAFGLHNLTSDTEPSELVFIERSVLIDRYSSYSKESDTVKNNEPYLQFCEGRLNALTNLFGDKCLPDTSNTPNSGELKPKDSENQPKFNKGDKVKIIVSDDGEVATIRARDTIGGQFVYWLEGSLGYYWESQLEPYTEPEAKNAKLSTLETESRNLSQNIANCDKPKDNQLKDNMEEKELGKEDNFPTKELNLAELLKGCVGEWFYVTPCGEMELKEINKLELKPLHFSRNTINCLTKTDGRAYENGSCIIYPSRALYEKYPLDPYSAWMEWKESRKPKRWRAEDAGVYWYIDATGRVSQTVDSHFCSDDNLYDFGNYFKTEKLCQQAAEAVRECLEKFHKDHSEK